MSRSIQGIISHILCYAVAAAITASAARATNLSWNNGSGGVLFFSDANNWTPNGVPGANDTSTFSLNNSYTVRFVTSPYTEGLTVSAGNVAMAGFVGDAQYYYVNSAPNSSISIYNSAGNTAVTLGLTGNPLYLITHTLSVANGAALTAQDGSLVTCDSFGFGLNGNITIDASSFNLVEYRAPSSTSVDQYIGSGGGSGSLTFQNGGGGNIWPTSGGGPMSLRIGDDTPGSTGVLAIHSGSKIYAHSNILLATRNVSSTATIYVDGVNSELNQYDYSDGVTTTPSGITVGSASLGTAAIYVGDLPTGGTLTTGSGGLVINKTGTVQVGSFSTTGKLIANGNVTVHGGVLWTRFGSEFFMPVAWRLTIDDGGTANMESYNPNPGTVNFVSGSFSYFGDLEVGPGGLLGTNLILDATRQLSLTGTTSVDNGHVFQLTGGALHTGALVNNGYIDLGSGILTTSAATLAAGSTLEIDLGGTTRNTQYGALVASGSVSLAGSLTISVLNTFSPVAGNSFDILDWGSHTGAFSTLSLPTLTTGLTWNVSQLYTTGMISVVASGLAGDFNHNGVVDAADYVVWRNGLGTVYTQADYNVWRTHFGQTAGSGSGAVADAAVPEPSAFVLAAVGFLGLSACRRHVGRDRVFLGECFAPWAKEVVRLSAVQSPTIH